MTLRFALLGHPVSHSLSPTMHNAAFQHLGLGARYELWDVKSEELPAALERAARELTGFNVTVPHKAAVFERVGDMHDVATQVGAINTVKVSQGRLRGRNTDVFGIQRACADERFELEGAHVLVLGNGGAARAAVVAAARARASQVTIAARNLEKAKLLGDEMRAHFGAQCGIEAAELADASVYEPASLVLQATSATLEKPSGDTPDPSSAEAFATTVPLDALPDYACLMDLVYKPTQTTLMKRASERGLRTANGIGMLLHQGAAAFEWWTGELAPVDLMREVLRESV